MVWNVITYLSARVGLISSCFANLCAQEIAVLAQNPRFQHLHNSHYDDAQTPFEDHKGT